MATPSGSATDRSVGNAGLLTLSYIDTTGAGNNISVSFVPTLVRMTNPQYSPFQHVNVAVNGSVHIFQLATTEQLAMPVVFTDLPWDSTNIPSSVLTNGFNDLQSFIRYTLNYHENTCILTTPDGQIETVRYMNGMDGFQEATGNTNKVRFWTGTLTFWRVIE